MTQIGTRGRKLRLDKETIKDLHPFTPSQVKGGYRYNKCTYAYSGCTQSGN